MNDENKIDRFQKFKKEKRQKDKRHTLPLFAGINAPRPADVFDTCVIIFVVFKIIMTTINAIQCGRGASYVSTCPLAHAGRTKA